MHRWRRLLAVGSCKIVGTTGLHVTLGVGTARKAAPRWLLMAPKHLLPTNRVQRWACAAASFRAVWTQEGTAAFVFFGSLWFSHSRTVPLGAHPPARRGAAACCAAEEAQTLPQNRAFQTTATMISVSRSHCSSFLAATLPQGLDLSHLDDGVLLRIFQLLSPFDRFSIAGTARVSPDGCALRSAGNISSFGLLVLMSILSRLSFHVLPGPQPRGLRS